MFVAAVGHGGGVGSPRGDDRARVGGVGEDVFVVEAAYDVGACACRVAEVGGVGGPPGVEVDDGERVVPPAVCEADAAADGGVVRRGVGRGRVEHDPAAHTRPVAPPAGQAVPVPLVLADDGFAERDLRPTHDAARMVSGVSAARSTAGTLWCSHVARQNQRG